MEQQPNSPPELTSQPAATPYSPVSPEYEEPDIRVDEAYTEEENEDYRETDIEAGKEALMTDEEKESFEGADPDVNLEKVEEASPEAEQRQEDADDQKWYRQAVADYDKDKASLVQSDPQVAEAVKKNEEAIAAYEELPFDDKVEKILGFYGLPTVKLDDIIAETEKEKGPGFLSKVITGGIKLISKAEVSDVPKIAALSVQSIFNAGMEIGPGIVSLVTERIDFFKNKQHLGFDENGVLRTQTADILPDDWKSNPKVLMSDIVSVLTGFLTVRGALGISKLYSKYKGFKGVSLVMSGEAAAGGTFDFLTQSAIHASAMDTMNKHLDKYPAIKEMIPDLVLSKDDDTVLQKKLRAALVGASFDFAAEGAMLTFKGIFMLVKMLKAKGSRPSQIMSLVADEKGVPDMEKIMGDTVAPSTAVKPAPQSKALVLSDETQKKIININNGKMPDGSSNTPLKNIKDADLDKWSKRLTKKNPKYSMAQSSPAVFDYTVKEVSAGARHMGLEADAIESIIAKASTEGLDVSRINPSQIVDELAYEYNRIIALPPRKRTGILLKKFEHKIELLKKREFEKAPYATIEELEGAIKKDTVKGVLTVDAKTVNSIVYLEGEALEKMTNAMRASHAALDKEDIVIAKIAQRDFRDARNAYYKIHDIGKVYKSQTGQLVKSWDIRVDTVKDVGLAEVRPSQRIALVRKLSGLEEGIKEKLIKSAEKNPDEILPENIVDAYKKDPAGVTAKPVAEKPPVDFTKPDPEKPARKVKEKEVNPLLPVPTNVLNFDVQGYNVSLYRADLIVHDEEIAIMAKQYANVFGDGEEKLVGELFRQLKRAKDLTLMDPALTRQNPQLLKSGQAVQKQREKRALQKLLADNTIRVSGAKEEAAFIHQLNPNEFATSSMGKPVKKAKPKTLNKHKVKTVKEKEEFVYNASDTPYIHPSKTIKDYQKIKNMTNLQELKLNKMLLEEDYKIITKELVQFGKDAVKVHSEGYDKTIRLMRSEADITDEAQHILTKMEGLDYQIKMLRQDSKTIPLGRKTRRVRNLATNNMKELRTKMKIEEDKLKSMPSLKKVFGIGDGELPTTISALAPYIKEQKLRDMIKNSATYNGAYKRALQIKNDIKAIDKIAKIEEDIVELGGQAAVEKRVRGYTDDAGWNKEFPGVTNKMRLELEKEINPMFNKVNEDSMRLANLSPEQVLEDQGGGLAQRALEDARLRKKQETKNYMKDVMRSKELNQTQKEALMEKLASNPNLINKKAFKRGVREALEDSEAGAFERFTRKLGTVAVMNMLSSIGTKVAIAKAGVGALIVRGVDDIGADLFNYSSRLISRSTGRKLADQTTGLRIADRFFMAQQNIRRMFKDIGSYMKDSDFIQNSPYGDAGNHRFKLGSPIEEMGQKIDTWLKGSGAETTGLAKNLVKVNKHFINTIETVFGFKGIRTLDMALKYLSVPAEMIQNIKTKLNMENQKMLDAGFGSQATSQLNERAQAQYARIMAKVKDGDVSDPVFQEAIKNAELQTMMNSDVGVFGGQTRNVGTLVRGIQSKIHKEVPGIGEFFTAFTSVTLNGADWIARRLPVLNFANPAIRKQWMSGDKAGVMGQTFTGLVLSALGWGAASSDKENIVFFDTEAKRRTFKQVYGSSAYSSVVIMDPDNSTSYVINETDPIGGLFTLAMKLQNSASKWKDHKSLTSLLYDYGENIVTSLSPQAVFERYQAIQDFITEGGLTYVGRRTIANLLNVGLIRETTRFRKGGREGDAIFSDNELNPDYTKREGKLSKLQINFAKLYDDNHNFLTPNGTNSPTSVVTAFGDEVFVRESAKDPHNPFTPEDTVSYTDSLRNIPTTMKNYLDYVNKKIPTSSDKLYRQLLELSSKTDMTKSAEADVLNLYPNFNVNLKSLITRTSLRDFLMKKSKGEELYMWVLKQKDNSEIWERLHVKDFRLNDRAVHKVSKLSAGDKQVYMNGKATTGKAEVQKLMTAVLRGDTSVLGSASKIQRWAKTFGTFGYSKKGAVNTLLNNPLAADVKSQFEAAMQEVLDKGLDDLPLAEKRRLLNDIIDREFNFSESEVQERHKSKTLGMSKDNYQASGLDSEYLRYSLIAPYLEPEELEKNLSIRRSIVNKLVAPYNQSAVFVYMQNEIENNPDLAKNLINKGLNEIRYQ